MNTPEVDSGSEWKQFLRLGESLLNQPTANAQCEIIVSALQQRLNCKAKIWLARPYYPLPGELEAPTLPDADAPEPVRQTFSTRQMNCLTRGQIKSSLCGEEDHPFQVAMPLIAQGDLLGVIQVQRPENQPFEKEEVNFLIGLSAIAALAMQNTRHVALKNWRYEQLTLVRSVSAKISKVLELDELCRQVTRLIQETFHYYYVAIFTLEPNEDRLYFRASASQNNVQIPRSVLSLPLGKGMIGTVALTGKELLARDVNKEPHYHYLDALNETRSEFTVPLKIENHVLGVLDAQSDQLDAFRSTDRIVLRALADNIALAIDGARLYNDLRRRAEQINAIFEVSRILTSILDLDQLLKEVVQLIQTRFGYPFVDVYTVHPSRGKILYRAGSGERSRAMHEYEYAYNLNDSAGMIPWVARTGRTMLANDVSQEPHYRPSALPPSNTRSELTVPLMFGGEIQGVLDIQSNRINAFDENDRFLFEALAASIAIAIRNATVYRIERWRRQVADSFRDVAGLVSANIALDKLLDTILTELEHNLPCEVAAIWFLDKSQSENSNERPTLKLAAAHGTAPEKIIQALEESEVARAWLEQTLESSQPMVRQPTDPYGPLGIAMGFPPEYSSIAASLRAGNRLLGVLALAHKTPGRYSSEASALTATFANYAAVAIQNARLYAEAQEQAWTSTVLLQVAEAGQSCKTLDELLSTMVRLIPLLLGVKKCALFIREEMLQAFHLRSCHGIELETTKPIYLSQDLPAFSQLLSGQAPVFVKNAAEELRLPQAGLPSDTGTLVLLPLSGRGRLMGAILIAHDAAAQTGLEQGFTGQTLTILRGIAHQLATAVENLALEESRLEESYVTAVLLQVAQAVVSQNDLNDILDTIVHLMPILVGIDTCVVYLWDEAQNGFRPAKAHSDWRELEEQLVGLHYQRGEFKLLDKVIRHNQSFFCPLTNENPSPPHWTGLDCTTEQEFVSSYAINHWLMGLPLSVKGDVFGVLLAKESDSSPAVRGKRLEIVNGIAQQTALAIQNEIYQAELVGRERLEREFELARQIQKSFLPSRFPEVKGWELDARWQTALRVGGDFYDVFQLGHHRLGLVVADVSDKGMPAALYMAVSRTLIRANAQQNSSPAGVLARVNSQLLMDSQNGMFVTAVYAILDTQTGRLTYANAGHNRPLILRAGTRQVEVLPKGGMALGVLEDTSYTDHELKIHPGDCLIFYTDGVTESFAPSGDSFGENRLLELVSASIGMDACQILDRIDNALIEFRQGIPLSDDITILTVRNLPAEER